MKNPLLKYKIGLGLLVLGVLALVTFVVLQAGGAKQDAQTVQRANDIANKLNDYVTNHNATPGTLAEAGVHDAPATISYRKVSGQKYVFCVTYRESSMSSEQLSPTAISDAIQGSSLSSGGEPDAGIDGEAFVPDSHHAGQSCRTVTPLLSTPPPVIVDNDKNIVCGVSTDYYETLGTIDNVSQTGGLTFVEISTTSSVGVQKMPYEFSADSKVFDQSCNLLQLSELHSGDQVAVYDIAPPNAQSISIFLKQ